jgi:hypothetical protein
MGNRDKMKDDAIAQLSDQFHFAQIYQLNGIDMIHNKYKKST